MGTAAWAGTGINAKKIAPKSVNTTRVRYRWFTLQSVGGKRQYGTLERGDIQGEIETEISNTPIEISISGFN